MHCTGHWLLLARLLAGDGLGAAIASPLDGPWQVGTVALGRTGAAQRSDPLLPAAVTPRVALRAPLSLPKIRILRFDRWHCLPAAGAHNAARMRVLIASGHRHVDEFIEEVLGRHPQVSVAGRPVVDRSFLLPMVEHHKPDVALIGEGLPGEGDLLQLLARMAREHPEVRVVFLLEDPDPAHALRMARDLFRLGIFDVVIPQEDGLSEQDIERAVFYPSSRAAALRRIADLERAAGVPQGSAMEGLLGEEPQQPVQEAASPGDEKPDAEARPLEPEEAAVVAFWSPMGGSGCTTLAVNYAVLLAQRSGTKVALVDANPRHPHVHLYTGVYDPSRHLGAAYRQAIQSGTGHGWLHGLLLPCRTPNLYILPGAATEPAFHWEARNEEIFRQLFRHLAGYAHVVLDCGDDPAHPLTRQALLAARTIYVPLRPYPPAVFSFARCLKPGGDLLRAGVLTEKIRVLCNGAKADPQFAALLKEATGLEVSGWIGDHGEALRRAAYAGLPLLVSSPSARLAHELEPLLPQAYRRRRWLPRITRP